MNAADDPNIKWPKISIVTPSYNQGRYIEQTILSVLDQQYPNLEYIIIDGGSTDNTVEIIKKYEKHLTWWVSEPDKGQTDAINKGFAKCTGDIFNWINSDDYYEPEVLLTIGKLFADNPAVNVVCGKEWGFNDNDPSDRILHPGSVIESTVFETIVTGIIDQPCTFFRKDTIDGYFPLDLSLRYVMDRQLWWSYLLQYGQEGILQTNKVFTNFRLHPQSKSTAEGDLFESEYDRLKLSLFRQLNAPAILEQQLSHQQLVPLPVKWEVNVKPVAFVLAAFASLYAERNYVHKNLAVTTQLMKYVQSQKGLKMNKKEWKLWVLTNLIPMPLLSLAKKIKGSN